MELCAVVMLTPRIKLLVSFSLGLLCIGCTHSLGPDARDIEVNKKTLPDYHYLRNTYFFLDDSYRENYHRFDDKLNHLAVSNPIEESSISVFIADASFYMHPEAVRGWATRNATAWDTLDGVIPGQSDFGYFVRLDDCKYHLEPNLGFIRMVEALPVDQVLAVTYATVDGDVYGENLEASKNLILKLIRDRNPRPPSQIWDLTWRHVYSLGETNIDPEGFDVKIWFNPLEGPPEEIDKTTGQRWTQIFGLDFTDRNGVPGNPDGAIDMETGVVDLIDGELHFPDLRPFDPEGFVVGHVTFDYLPDEKRTPALYDTTVQTVIRAQSKFSIEISTKKKP